MSALGVLFQAVKESFRDNAGNISVVFGEREPARQDNQGTTVASRIVFVPCDGDAVGDWAPARDGNIGRLEEKCAIFIWACDPDAPEDELAQHDATRDLLSVLYQFLWKHAAGRIHFTNVRRIAAGDKLERRNGSEWRFVVTLPDDLEPDGYLTATDLTPGPRFVFTLPSTS